ncbi:MAG: VanZ family protein [Rhizobacter sp.]
MPDKSNSFAHLLATVLRPRRPWQLLLLMLIGIVCYLALTPAPPKTLSLGWDKANHAAAFAALTLAGCFGFQGSRRVVLAVLLALLAFGGLIEILQAYVPGRDSDWADLLADTVGIVCGVVPALCALRLSRRSTA